MKITIFFVIFSSIFLLNSTLRTNLLLISSTDDENLSKNICKITNNVTNSSTDTQDILIVNLAGKVWSSTINDIVKCIDDGTAVVVTDFKAAMTEKNLRKAAVVILAIDRVDKDLAAKIIADHQFSTILHHMTKVICITPSTSTLNQRLKVLEVFLGYGFLNTAMVHKTPAGDIFYEIVTSLANRGRLLRNPQDSSQVFPDKLKDTKGFQYKVPIYYQPPVVEVINDQVYAPMMFFLQLIGIAQNANIEMIYLKNSSYFVQYWLKRQMHLTINTAVVINIPDPKLITYEKKSYCALVPIPQKDSIFHLIFVKPFDGSVWTLFGFSIVCSVAVWRMFRGRGAVDSHWQLAFGIFTMFIGQGAEFSRKNRFVLAILLNIICFSVFLLSNLYEGVITSFMIEPAHETRMKTVEELLDSDYEVMSIPLFEHTLRNSSLVEKMGSRLNLSGLLMGTEGGRHVIEQQYVYIRTCDVAKISLSEKLPNGRYVSDYYYLLPEELSWQYIQLEASYFNPFLERFQDYMDLSFQAGLPHMWKVMASQDYSEFMNVQAKDGKDFLELQDLVLVFVVLFIGLCLSAFVLLLEIFYHDFIKNLNLRGVVRSMWSRIKRMFCKKNRMEKPKVRRIIVRPRPRHE